MDNDTFSLVLEYCSGNDALGLISAMPFKVKKLTLICHEPEILENDLFKILATCQELEYLEIYKSKMTDNEMKYIGSLKKLKHLVLDQQDYITSRAIWALSQCHNLEYLKIATCYELCDSNGIWAISNLTSLKHLVFYDIFEFLNFEALQDLKNLVYLEFCNVAIEDLDFLKYLPKLEYLILYAIEISQKMLNSLKSCVHLKELTILDSNLPFGFHLDLEYMPYLEKLNLSRSDICLDDLNKLQIPENVELIRN